MTLVVETTIANQRNDLACAAYRDALATGLAPPELTVHASLAQTCSS
jgi:hypothetical protein